MKEPTMIENKKTSNERKRITSKRKTLLINNYKLPKKIKNYKDK